MGLPAIQSRGRVEVGGKSGWKQEVSDSGIVVSFAKNSSADQRHSTRGELVGCLMQVAPPTTSTRPLPLSEIFAVFDTSA